MSIFFCLIHGEKVLPKANSNNLINVLFKRNSENTDSWVCRNIKCKKACKQQDSAGYTNSESIY